jgi:hypothetical protein
MNSDQQKIKALLTKLAERQENFITPVARKKMNYLFNGLLLIFEC